MRRERKPDLSSYGWPSGRPPRDHGRTDAIASLLVLVAVVVVTLDLRSFVPTWSQYPAWWVPLALVVAAALLVAAGRIRR